MTESCWRVIQLSSADRVGLFFPEFCPAEYPHHSRWQSTPILLPNGETESYGLFFSELGRQTVPEILPDGAGIKRIPHILFPQVLIGLFPVPRGS